MSRAPRIAAHTLFFPAAAAYAAAALPASVLAMLGLFPALPGLGFPAGHAHEMLFGFALAAVAGHQLGPAAPRILALLFGAWLAARVAFLAAPGHAVATLLNGAFAALLAWHVAPRLFTRAKKLRNRALPLAIAALCASAVALGAALQFGAHGAQRGILLVAVLVAAFLMLFVGGRIIAPAAAGAHYRRGADLGARVQPLLEGTLVAVMAAVVVAAASGFLRPAGATLLLAAAVAAVRLARWRLWRLRASGLLGLAAGYAWLAAGLAATGIALLAEARLVAALHLITVGALGTLALNVMATMALRAARRDPATARIPVGGTALMAAATAARVAADFGAVPGPGLLVAAAACWSAAWLLLLVLLGNVRHAIRS